MSNRLFTAEDVAFICEMRTEGVRDVYLAKYVFGISVVAFRSRLLCWGVK